MEWKHVSLFIRSKHTLTVQTYLLKLLNGEDTDLNKSWAIFIFSLLYFTTSGKIFLNYCPCMFVIRSLSCDCSIVERTCLSLAGTTESVHTKSTASGSTEIISLTSHFTTQLISSLAEWTEIISELTSVIFPYTDSWVAVYEAEQSVNSDWNESRTYAAHLERASPTCWRWKLPEVWRILAFLCRSWLNNEPVKSGGLEENISIRFLC